MSSFPRITKVERITLDVPFRPRCHPWNMLLVRNWRVVEVVRVTTDGGLTGYGETLPHYTWGRVPEGAEERVIGANPAELLGDDSLGAGLQMALYDVVGKALEVPVHRLFNQPQVRDWCPISWWNTKMPPEVLAEEAQDAVREGYLAHKFKGRPWFDVYAQVEAISAVTPPHYRLEIDWNDMLLNAGNAAPVLAELDRYERIALYEGPIPQRDVEGYRHLRRKTTRPIAAHLGLPPFAMAIREEMCDGFVLSGGISAILRDGALCAAFEKPLFLQMVGTGLTTALMAHLGAVLPAAQWPAITCMSNFADDLLTEPLTIQAGAVRTPEGPGLGVEVDEEALERYRMEPPYEIPHPRHLLTVRWPGGRAVHYASMSAAVSGGARKAAFSHLQHAQWHYQRQGMQCWEDFLAGNHPVQERGARLEIWDDDGSTEWADLHARALLGPVREQQ